MYCIWWNGRGRKISEGSVCTDTPNKGINSSRIIKEDKSTSTRKMRFSKKIMEEGIGEQIAVDCNE